MSKNSHRYEALDYMSFLGVIKCAVSRLAYSSPAIVIYADERTITIDDVEAINEEADINANIRKEIAAQGYRVNVVELNDDLFCVNRLDLKSQAANNDALKSELFVCQQQQGYIISQQLESKDELSKIKNEIIYMRQLFDQIYNTPQPVGAQA
ncbi:MAG: hypothetical protein ACI4AM_04025 [Muribaculaceae bacterium]